MKWRICYLWIIISPNIRRIPSHVWLRLKTALKGLIAESENGCYVWFHRQLKETAEERYLPEKQSSHTLMGMYFGNLVDDSIVQSRKITKQEWVVKGENPFLDLTVVNKRRCHEAAYHLLTLTSTLSCFFMEKAVNELCYFDGICS